MQHIRWMPHGTRWLRVLLGLTSLFFILLFLYTAMRRLTYPFEVDRMESAMVTSVWRLSQGKPLYSAPTLEWVPFLYAPLYFYLSWAASHLTGVGYAATRLVSTLATCGCFVLLYLFVKRETGNRLAGLAAAGVFASLYSLVLGWYDVGRVDSLSVFFLLLALYCTRFSHPLVAAFIWVLAFQSKQSLLPLGIILFLPLFRQPKRMLIGMAGFAVMAGASIAWMQHASAGWYSFYVFGTASQLKFVPRLAVLFVPNDILAVLGVAVVLMMAAAVVRPVAWNSGKVLFYTTTTVILGGLIGFVRGHAGANINAVIPMYLWLSLLMGLAVARLLHWSTQLAPEARLRASTLILAAAILQIGMNLYSPVRWIPSADSRAHRNEFLDQLKTAPGDVWVGQHSWDNVLAHKPLHAELDSLDAITSRPPSPRTQPLLDELQNAYATQKFSAVILDHDAADFEKHIGYSSDLFHQHYGLRINAAGSDQAGMIDQPLYVYAPCDSGSLPGDPWRVSTATVNSRYCEHR